MGRSVAAAAFLLTLSGTGAGAAFIELVAGSEGQADLIVISGPIELNDDRRFKDLALKTDYRAVIVIDGPGGSVKAGMEIGRAIRLKEFVTVVPADGSCASACALAWLGGVRRLMDRGARVGFHAAYVERDGLKQESGMANALVGAYLNQLGLSQRAIQYITFRAPDEIQWLTEEDASRFGIDVAALNARPPPSRTTRPRCSQLRLLLPQWLLLPPCPTLRSLARLGRRPCRPRAPGRSRWSQRPSRNSS